MNRFILLPILLTLSLKTFAMSPEEYVTKTAGYIKSCGTLVVFMEDRAAKRERYSQLILEELYVRANHYYRKYNSSDIDIATFKQVATNVITRCGNYSSSYVNVDKAFSDEFRSRYEK